MPPATASSWWTSTDASRSVNRKFAELWRLPADLLATRVDASAIEYVLPQLVNPELFAAKVAEVYADPEAHSHDVLHFHDGRVFDRYSQPQYVDGEIVGRVWCFRDSTERNRLEEQLAHQALHDPLTGLANQTLFRDRVDHALTRSSGNLAVVFLDIDNFKTVNDSLGHSAGDRLLVGVTDRLRQCLRGVDTAARLGGDEFAVLLEDAGSEADVMRFAQRLLGAFKRTFTIEGIEVSASLSIGIAFVAPGVTQRPSSCGTRIWPCTRPSARARAASRSTKTPCTPRAVRRLQEEAELRGAIERDELVPSYQPIVELATGRLVAVEALARWHHPTRGELATERLPRARPGDGAHRRHQSPRPEPGVRRPATLAGRVTRRADRSPSASTSLRSSWSVVPWSVRSTTRSSATPSIRVG